MIAWFILLPLPVAALRWRRRPQFEPYKVHPVALRLGERPLIEPAWRLPIGYVFSSPL